ncbi:cytochrome P450 4A25-like [Lingula anatina]|uniref:Cytochrome P450 4A25-like n=1 Tax=Lingula anatina TaxID=7574 RepID=A0A1S3JYV6_LINAN|nr:cytochrome P450 4A25-like [Lingula anatina]|eukprot:XP_013415216.1 cytochrome P450 4A25-like [Lingula anatina]
MFPEPDVITVTVYILSILLGLVLYRFMVWYMQILVKVAFIDQFPGPPKHWLWGNLHQHPGMNDACLKWILQLTEQHKTAFRYWFGPFKACVAVVHPDTVKVILNTTEPKTSLGGYNLMQDWLGNGLLLSKGELWHRNRKLISPGFHFDVLKPYVNIYNRTVEVFMGKMSAAASLGTSFEVSSPLGLCTLDTMLQCAFSVQEKIQEQGDSHPFSKATAMLCRLVLDRALKPYLFNDFIYSLTKKGREWKRNCQFVHKFADHVIQERKQLLKQDSSILSNKKHLDLLDILLGARDENGEGMTDKEIRDEASTFLFAGHDTSSNAISWTLYSLAKHPVYQDKIRDEVDEILHGRTKDDILWQDLPKLEYLTLVLKESLRMHSPAVNIARETTQEWEIDGLKVPPGICIDIWPWAVHHNPHVWDNHMEFQPERFLPENMEHMDPFAYIPFSAGPRNCIGKHFAMNELKVMVARIIHRFHLELDPDHDYTYQPDAVLRAKHGIKLFVKERKT